MKCWVVLLVGNGKINSPSGLTFDNRILEDMAKGNPKLRYNKMYPRLEAEIEITNQLIIDRIMGAPADSGPGSTKPGDMRFNSSRSYL